MFSHDSRFMQTLTRVTDLIVLNICFLISCIPIVTIGAANAAMYTLCFRMLRDEDNGIVKSYFRAFRDNFKQATLLWLLAAAVGLVVAADITVCWGFDMEAGMMLSVMQLSKNIIFL